MLNGGKWMKLMNRILKLFLLVALFTGVIMTPTQNVFASKDIKVLLEGQEILFDVAPQIIEGRTLVPMRAIFEAIGLSVNWDNSSKVATGSNSNTTIIFSIGSNKAIVNNQEKILDVPASIIKGRTMVPLRFLSKNMDYNEAKMSPTSISGGYLLS
ncbi:copper amine oxidase N-terminal domain-containing protein [Tissierella creatinini]|nr:copper amine oxidase N-terminal domain-containing protein [Tissierella creatinini]